MKLFMVTAYKIKMLLSDRLFFAAMIIIPLLIAVVAGYALRNEKLNVVPVAFVDDDGTDSSEKLLKGISSKEGLTVLTTSHEEAADALENGKVEQVYIIRQGFEQSILHGETEGLIDVVSAPSSYSSGFTAEVVAGEVARLITQSEAADWVAEQYKKLGKPTGTLLRKEVEEYYRSLWNPKPLMTIDYREMTGDAVAEKQDGDGSRRSSAPGLLAAFVMFFMLFGSGWLVEEKANGTIKRLAAAPGALGLSFAGNALALLTAGLLQLLLFAAAEKLLFGVDLFRDLWSYAVFVLYMVAVVSLSLFMSSVFKTPAQLQAAAPVIALLTGFAGGCFWSFSAVPERLGQLARLTPQGWIIEAVNTLSSASRDPSAVLLPVFVLSTLILILLPSSYFLIKKSIEN